MASVTEIAMTSNSNPVYNLASLTVVDMSASVPAQCSPPITRRYGDQSRTNQQRTYDQRQRSAHQIVNIALSGAGQAQPSDDELATL